MVSREYNHEQRRTMGRTEIQVHDDREAVIQVDGWKGLWLEASTTHRWRLGLQSSQWPALDQCCCARRWQ